MNKKLPISSQQIVDNVARALGSVEAARLLDVQFEELKNLQTEVIQLCSSGKEEDARRLEKLIENAVDEGPPESE